MAQEQTSYKRNWKKWIAIYLAVGVVVYLIVYFAFFAGGGSGGY